MGAEQKPIDEAANEKWYDEEVAPLLEKLAKQCEERGMALMAGVYNKDSAYLSLQKSPHRGPAERIANAALRSLNNVDNLIMALMRDAETHGHSSMFMAQLLKDNKKE